MATEVREHEAGSIGSYRAATALVLAALVLLSAGAVAMPVAGQSETITLTVSVVDRSGAAVGGATVTATWDGGNDTETTANNGRAFVDVPAGRMVTFTVDHPDYVRNFPRNVTRTSDSRVTLDVARRSELTLVSEDAEGARVGGATVALTQDGRVVDRGRTDADGQYVSGTIEAGQYTVRLTKPGYYNRTVTVAPNGPTTRQVTLESGSVQYEFRVVDDHFDPPRPVPNVTVRVGTIATLRTLDNGRATVGIPVNTVQQVEVSKGGYRTITRQVRVAESGGQRTFRVRRKATLSVNASADRVVVGERVTVRVRNAYDEPVEGAEILRNGSVVGRTAADGTYDVRVPGQQAAIRARANGVTSDTITIEGVVPGGRATATPSPTPSPTATQSGGSYGFGPGFGPVVAVAALATLAVVLVRRR